MDALAIFKALSNPTRLQIMEWLAHPAKYFDEDSYTQQDLGFHIGVCVGDIQGRSGLAQSVISGYLQGMKMWVCSSPSASGSGRITDETNP